MFALLHISVQLISVFRLLHEMRLLLVCLTTSYDVIYMYVISIPISSSGHFDYVPVNKTVSFHGSQVHCVNIQIVHDELTETEESFYVEVMVESRKLVSLLVIISSNSEYNKVTCDTHLYTVLISVYVVM